MTEQSRARRYNYYDIETWFDRSFDPKSRTLYLGSVSFDSEGKEGGVDALMAEFAIKALHVLNEQSGRKKINVMMNNLGGSWTHGMAIYDAIRASTAPVDIEVNGAAMSMGAVILQSARNRYMHPNATLMIHDGTTGGVEQPVETNRRWTEHEEKLRKDMYSIFTNRSGGYPSTWKRICSHDTIYTAHEAVDVGLADKVLMPSRALPPPRPSKKQTKRKR